MGNKTLVYRKKVEDNIKESQKHLQRLNNAFDYLDKSYTIPFNINEYKAILDNLQDLAFCDQVIYRFSKLQDCMGAKLFKSILLYQGENINRPFLDILNQLEKMDIVFVDDWFEIRDLRNAIAHDYEENDKTAIDILNMIYSLKNELEKILNSIVYLVNKEKGV